MSNNNAEHVNLWSLTGEFKNIRLDEKNRLNIPAQHRAVLKPLFNSKSLTFLISKAPKLQALHITPKTSNVEEFLSEHSDICYKYDTRGMDKNSRITIDVKLLTQLETNEYTLIGNGHRLELWNADAWEQEKQQREKIYTAKADGAEYVI